MLIYINTLDEIPEKTNDITILYWNLADRIPDELLANLTHLYCPYLKRIPVLPKSVISITADSVLTIDYLPPNLEFLSAINVTKINCSIPVTITHLFVDCLKKLDLTYLDKLRFLYADSLTRINHFPSTLSNLSCKKLRYGDIPFDRINRIYHRNGFWSCLNDKNYAE